MQAWQARTDGKPITDRWHEGGEPVIGRMGTVRTFQLDSWELGEIIVALSDRMQKHPTGLGGVLREAFLTIQQRSDEMAYFRGFAHCYNWHCQLFGTLPGEACPICGVVRGDPCEECGGESFHEGRCSQIEEPRG